LKSLKIRNDCSALDIALTDKLLAVEWQKFG
jgi:hypothetical protein